MPEVLEIKLDPTGACKCGCGGMPSNKRNFLPGHDQRLIGKLTRATRAGDEIFTIEEGKRNKTDALTFGAVAFGDTGLLKLRRHLEIVPKAKKAKPKVEIPPSKVGDEVAIKVGRNTFPAVVNEIDETGKPTKVTYKNKRDEERTVEDFKLVV